MYMKMMLLSIQSVSYTHLIKEEPFELTKIINEVSSVIETQADEQCIDYSVDRGSIEYDNLICLLYTSRCV